MEGRKIFWTPWCKEPKGFCSSVLPSECPSPWHPTAPKKDWERQAALARSIEKLRMVSLGYGKKKKIAALSIPIVHMGWNQIWLRKISNQHWFINSNFHYSELSDRPENWAHTLADPEESQKQPCEVFQLQKKFCLEFILSRTQRKQTKLVPSKADFVHSHWHRTGHCSSHWSAALP